MRPTPVTTQAFGDLKQEISKTILALDCLEVPIIYIDEYSVHQDAIGNYNWAPKR